MDNFYTMVFKVRNEEEFSKLKKPLFETMGDPEKKAYCGVQLTGASVGSVMAELGDWQRYADYLRDYADNRVGSYTMAWEFEEWEDNGKPESFDEDAHTEESYQEENS